MSRQDAPLTPMACLRWDVVDRILREVRPTSVLEIGCGQGAAGTRLARQAKYVGVEPDGASQKVAAGRIEPLGGTVILGDDSAVPEGTSVDLVCAFEVLEHIDDDAEALRRWKGFLRPGGHLLLSVPAWQERFGPMDTLVGHFRRYSPFSMADRLRAAGLTDVQVSMYGWPLGYLLEYGRNRIATGRTARGETTGAEEDTAREEGTARSGRLFQPGQAVGAAVRAATVPFRYVQRVTPTKGIGIVAVASRPR